MPRCSLAATNVGSSSDHLCVALRCQPFDTCDHTSGHMFPVLAVPFLRQSALNPRVSFWLIVEQRESFTPIHGANSDVSPTMFQ